MSDPRSSTIFALATAPGRSGVAVIRVSGPRAGTILNVMAPPRPKPRQAGGRCILHPKTGEVLDRGIVLWFPAPNSFTGEDVAEIQVHGSRAVVAAVIAALSEIPGCRLAEPGEFARRSFWSGKIDLAEAEGLADLIEAETEAQRKQAVMQATGAVSAIYEGWRSSLIDALALVEAAIDFSDEADVGTSSFNEAAGRVETLRAAIRHHLKDGHRGEILRDGFKVALLGAPNVGKSSLLNALARRQAAIVSEEAGTTRDVIEVRLDLSGLPVIVSDTAGLREASGKVEAEGIRRSLETGKAADLLVWVMEAGEPEAVLPEELLDCADRTLLVLNKIDLVPGSGEAAKLPDDMLPVSAATGQGLDELAQRIGALAAERIGTLDAPAIAHVRHRLLIEAADAALGEFLEGAPMQVELRAEDLRRAASALGRITGRVDVEDVLDQVFGRFCIGK